MSDANQHPGEAAAAAAGLNDPSPQPATSPPAKSPVSKVTMRVSLKAPTPGSGPASLAPDPTRDVVDEAAQPVAQATPPALMAAPLNIAPVFSRGTTVCLHESSDFVSGACPPDQRATGPANRGSAGRPPSGASSCPATRGTAAGPPRPGVLALLQAQGK